MIDIFVTKPIIGGFSSGVNPIMYHNWKVKFHDGTVMVKTYTIGSEPKIGEVTEFGVIIKVEKMPMSIEW